MTDETESPSTKEQLFGLLTVAPALIVLTIGLLFVLGIVL